MKMIFVHQGKTGGTTLFRALEDYFGASSCYHDCEGRDRQSMFFLRRSWENLISPYRSYQNLAHFRLIYGHMNPSKYKRVFPDAKYITYFRNPIQQFVSLYNFWKRPIRGKIMPVYRRRLINENLSLLSFAEMMAEAPYGSDSKIKSLNPEYFDFVGITERYAQSLQLLKAMYLPDMPIGNIAEHRINPNKTVDEAYQLNAHTLARIEALFPGRIELYHRAVRRFESDYSSFF